MSNYLLLNEAFCLANNGYQNGTGAFGWRQTISGYYVAAQLTLYDMPELFENDIYLQGIIIIELEVSAFPVPTLP